MKKGKFISGIAILIVGMLATGLKEGRYGQTK